MEQNALFTTAELDGIQPTGSPWIINDDDPATVPVPLQVVIVSVEGPYTERDRKLWTFLLHTMFDKLGTEVLHELPVSQINSVFRELGGDHGTKWIWESAKRLAKTTIEFEYTEGDERFLGITSLFGAVVTKEARMSGRLKFHFPPLLVPIIKEPMRFARLRVHFMMKLSGKYAVTLYEILESYANRRDGTCRVTIDELRTWLKVPSDAYPDWKNFRHRVLRPAIDQINNDPLGAGFSVEYTPIRKGRFYNEIIFKLTKTDNRKQQDRALKNKANLAKKIAGSSRPVLKPDTFDKVKKACRGIDVYAHEHDFWSHWESTGQQPFTKSADAAFINFCKKKWHKDQ